MTQFHPERPGLVTASRCSVLFPDRGDGLKGQISYAKQLAQEKYFGFADEVSTWQMEHGIMSESSAREWYIERFGLLEEVQYWVRKGNCGATIDGLDSSVIDFKCPTSLTEWLSYLYEPMKKEHYYQLQMGMWLTGRKKGKIVAFLEETERMTSNGIEYPIAKDKRAIVQECEVDQEFQDQIEDKALFVIRKRDEFIEKLKAEFK